MQLLSPNPFPQPLLPHSPQQESRRMIQIQLQHPPVVFEFSHPHPHPQFVAAKSLISYSSEIIFTMYLMRKRL